MVETKSTFFKKFCPYLYNQRQPEELKAWLFPCIYQKIELKLLNDLEVYSNIISILLNL